jgi:hypothetical protein
MATVPSRAVRKMRRALMLMFLNMERLEGTERIPSL